MLCTATLTSTMFLHYAQILQSVIILHAHTHTHFHHQQNVGAAVSHALLDLESALFGDSSGI